MKRIKINSRTANAHVSLSYPSCDANKTYILTVEKLVAPAMDSLLLNKPLFSVERRLAHDTDEDDETINLLPIHEQFTTFTPQNARNVSHLLYQMNNFLREVCWRCVSTGFDFDEDNHPTEVPDRFATQNRDWNNLNNREEISYGVMAILRPDGRLGFAFSQAGVQLFVIRLTDHGKTIFNRSHHYIAVGDNGGFDNEYDIEFVRDPLFGVDLNVLGDVELPDPIELGGYICLLDNSMFSHIQYRHELVLMTSLPLNNTVECDTNRSFYKRQLASYRFPDSDARMEYDSEPSMYEDTPSRYICESTQTYYVFDDNMSTHNKFIVTGTELQNFHVQLVSRNYRRQPDNTFAQVDTPYELHNETFYTLQLAVKQLNV